jgi:hypothetical protein
MEYINFIVDRQKLNYNSRCYVSTDTIDTLFCRFKFEIDSSGNARGGWNLPYLWAQFHDENGNTYVKPVKDGVCSIPSGCLKEPEFKMTLFATDTEDFMVCKKRYTTNEVSFKFKGLANLNYDGGVDPDEPIPSHWQILVDRVDECEDKVRALGEKIDDLPQDMSQVVDTVNELSTGLADESSARESADADLQAAIQEEANTRSEAIDNLNSTVNGLSANLADESANRDSADTRLEKLINDESTARTNSDANLQTLINDRYTKAQTDSLIGNEATARASADEDLQSLIDDEVTARENADSDLQSLIDGINTTVGGLSTRLANESTARTNADTRLEGLIGDESSARANADANLQSLINDRYTKTETDALVNAKQDKLNDSQLAAVNSGLTSNDKTTLDGLDSRVTTNTNDIATLDEQVEELKKSSGGGIDGVGAGFHSSIYRGKYLGDTYTDAQKQAIASGTFDDLFVGDYWTINDVNWRIADFDYYYNVGEYPWFDKHHVVIVPDRALYDARMNEEYTAEGCYSGSEMYTKNLDEARTAFDNAFGKSFIPAHSGLYANAITNVYPSGWAWRNMRVELMSEEQVYGHSVWSSSNRNGYDVGTQKTQFKLFMFDQTKINIRQNYWLTNTYNNDCFACVNIDGNVYYGPALHDKGVRPFACLVGNIG